MKHYDLIVVGSGPAASRVASSMARHGWSVAVIERRRFGGTCALRGCNPKKVLVHASDLADAVRKNLGTLIAADDVHIPWAELIRFKEEFVESVPESTIEGYEDAGIDCHSGAARFTGRQSLAVVDENGNATAELTADKILLATGARPADLDFPGAEYLTTSDDFLNLTSLPERVLFVGGGYISLEFAHVAQRAGADVTVVEQEDQILDGFEPELVDLLAEETRSLGVTLSTGSSDLHIEQRGEGYHVTWTAGGTAHELDCGLVVHGAGRVPNLDGLDLEAAGISSSENGIRIEPTLACVGNPHVYAAGDCADSGQPMLTPVANWEGRRLRAGWQSGEEQIIEYPPIPQVAYTMPRLARIGPLLSDAHEQYPQLDIRSGQHGSWSTYRKVHQECAHYRVAVDTATDKIIAAHILGPYADELINLFTIAITNGLTVTALQETAYAFPTFTGELRSLLKGG